jgi:hypothetical protein
VYEYSADRTQSNLDHVDRYQLHGQRSMGNSYCVRCSETLVLGTRSDAGTLPVGGRGSVEGDRRGRPRSEQRRLSPPKVTSPNVRLNLDSDGPER